MKPGTHVVYRRLESADKDGKHPISSFPAIILAHDPGTEDSAHVAYLNPGKLGLIGGADWRDAFDGSHSVPLGQGTGRDWYEPADAAHVKIRQKLNLELSAAKAEIAALKEQLEKPPTKKSKE